MNLFTGVRSICKRSAQSHIAWLLLVFATTLLTTIICIAQWRISSFVTAFWIPNVIIIAAWFQASGRRTRLTYGGIGIFGLLCGETIARVSWPSAFSFTAACTFEIAVTIGLVHLCLGKIVRLERARDLLTILALATIAGPALGAVAGATVIHAITPVPFGTAFVRWFFSHMSGMLVFGTFAISITQDEIRDVLRTKPLEAAGIFTVLVAATYAVFAQTTYPCLFAIFPLLMFAAYRLRFTGAAVAPLIVAVIATALTVNKSGPIYLIRALHTDEAAIRYLQFYLAFVVLTTLPVATILRERDRLARESTENEDKIWIGEELYRQIELHAPIGITIVSLQGRFLRVNPTLEAMFGYPPGELLTKGVGEVTVPEDLDRSRTYLDRLLAGQISSYQIEKRYVRKDGTIFWALLSTALIRSAEGAPLHIVAQILDISERRAREASMQTAKERAEAALAEQRSHADQHKFVNDATMLMQDSIDVHGTLDRLAQHMNGRLGDLCIVGVFGPPGDNSPCIIGTAAQSEYSLEQMGARQLRRKSREELLQYFDIAEDALSETSPFDGTAFATYLGEPRTILTSLLRAETGITGFIIVARPAQQMYTASDRWEIDEIARRLQAMLQVARSFQRERKLAQELQQAMLPTNLASPNDTTVDALYLPASAESDVGGDWFDSFTLPDGRLFISIGDVAGHGLSAAGAMGKIRHMIRAYALIDPEPVSVAGACDRAIAFLELPTTTAIFGLYDAILGSFFFVQAGHPAPVLVTPDRDVVILNDAPRTLPLGLIDDIPIEQAVVTLPHGSRLVMYTDGLIEFNRDVVSGEQILCESIAAAMAGDNAAHPAEAIARGVFKDIVPRDDTAILVLTAPEPSLASLSLNAKATPVNLRVLRQRIAAFASTHGVRGQSLARLEVAVGEALTNVLEHAYHFESGDIAVYGVGEVHRVWIEIADNGRWRPERDEGRGYGMSVMREFCDDVQIVRDTNGTRVRLTQEVPT